MDKLKHIIVNYDPALFHFLRPGVLYLFIPLGVIVGLLIMGNRDKKKWQEIIQPLLRPFLLTKGSKWAMLFPLLLFVIGSAFCILALAGPTWKQKQLPAEKIQAVLLMALDLSQSMLATDIQPTRLERAKFKISDLLDANPRTRTGLVAFAGSAHPVLPFTGDYKLIKHQAAALIPRSMPLPGTNIELLLAVADTLLHDVQAPSTILLLTDAINAEQAALLDNFIRGRRHHLEILLLSTPAGAKVPGHSAITSKQDPGVLQNLSPDSAITITPLTLDKSDVKGIAGRISQKLVFEKIDKQSEKEWEDMGWLLLIPALLIALFWFRRGWVIQWCWIGIGLSTLPSCGLNSKHPDWWYSKNYQGQLLENAGRYEEAADRFEDDEHKAIAWFKAGNYQAASDLFGMINSPSAVYNKGLALAKLGRYDEALDAFSEAVHLDPELKARAAGSITQTRSAKEKADSLLQYDARTVSSDVKSLAEKKKKKDPLKERKAESDDEKLSSDTRVKKLPTSGNRVTDETASKIHGAKEAKTPPKDLSLQTPAQSASQILLRQSAADPSEFQHRRFEMQVKR
jgi:Ca-activated chloride channel family protein